MKTFEDDVRAMLHRRAEDVSPVAPPWQQLTADELQHLAPQAHRARGLVAIAAVAALILGLVVVQVTRRDESTPSPAVDTITEEQPPFDPETTSAIWPVGRDGTATSWFRTALEETTRIQPPPSDDPRAVALTYLRDRFGAKAVTLDDTSEHGARTATYRWRVPIDTQDATGRVHLRRIVLPNGSFEAGDFAWVVVGATSDHLHVTALHRKDGRLQFELARHEAPFATMANVHLPTGVQQVDLDRPRAFDVALDRPVTIRAQLLGGAALTLTEFRVEPLDVGRPGTSLDNGNGLLWTGPGAGAVDVAGRYLKARFGLDEVHVEPVGPGTDDARYTSTAIGSGVVRIERRQDDWAIAAVVGDGLMVTSMDVLDERRRVTLSSLLPGRVSVTLRKGRDGEVIGEGSTRLPGVDMVAGVLVPMTGELDRGTAPFGEFRVEGPEGTTVALYCLPR